MISPKKKRTCQICSVQRGLRTASLSLFFYLEDTEEHLARYLLKVFETSKKLHGRWSDYYSYTPQKRSNADFGQDAHWMCSHQPPIPASEL